MERASHWLNALKSHSFDRIVHLVRAQLVCQSSPALSTDDSHLERFQVVVEHFAATSRQKCITKMGLAVPQTELLRTT
jgi:hypothetical protein